MQNEIIIGLIGLVGVYILYKVFNSTTIEHLDADPYRDVLTEEKYKVKGQWDK